jgi:hypothetical protein
VDHYHPLSLPLSLCPDAYANDDPIPAFSAHMVLFFLTHAALAKVTKRVQQNDSFSTSLSPFIVGNCIRTVVTRVKEEGERQKVTATHQVSHGMHTERGEKKRGAAPNHCLLL